MKNLLTLALLIATATLARAQNPIDCSPQCTVQCGKDQVAICKTKNGQCMTRCLSVPANLEGDQRKAFILSAVLEEEVTIEKVNQPEFKEVLRTKEIELDGAAVKFKEF